MAKSDTPISAARLVVAAPSTASRSPSPVTLRSTGEEPAPRKRYLKRPEEVWLAIRAAWELGGDRHDLAERYGVTPDSIRWRIKHHHWERRPPTMSAEAWPNQDPPPALRIAKTGLAHAMAALAAGRAADAVGAFADFVTNLRAKRDAPEPDADEGVVA